MTANLLTRSTDLPLFKRDRLARVAARYAPGADLNDDYLWSKLSAAEASVGHRLRVFLTPREIVPAGTDQATVDALVAAGETVVEEPGYDYAPSMFQGEAWGLIETRHRPIIAIRAITFAYPSATSPLLTIPPEWIRADKKFGRINLVPVQSIGAMQMSSFVLSAIGSGRSVPLMVQVRYRAGLADAKNDYPDLVDLIMRTAALSFIDDELLPQSGSVSADGLSQSISWDGDKMRDALDAKIDKLSQSINGIRCMVV
ncbi:MAG: hypothetical protein GC191_09190 [Azospirillum sp.]|nr:hypothetical protein [Azospirillum sp.]